MALKMCFSFQPTLSNNINSFEIYHSATSLPPLIPTTTMPKIPLYDEEEVRSSAIPEFLGAPQFYQVRNLHEYSKKNAEQWQYDHGERNIFSVALPKCNELQYSTYEDMLEEGESSTNMPCQNYAYLS